jgi:hypothetical protein
MPKIKRVSSNIRQSPFPVAQARQIGSVEPQPGHRNTVNWSSADDEVLVAARAAGLNWQTTAAKHFPNKTANACRKRHERLIERRTHEDWTTKRLNSLAVEYLELRKEIWEPLAAKTGERWSVVEAKASWGVSRTQTSALLTSLPVHGEGSQEFTVTCTYRSQDI